MSHKIPELHSTLTERMRSSNVDKSTAQKLADQSIRRTEARMERDAKNPPPPKNRGN